MYFCVYEAFVCIHHLLEVRSERAVEGESRAAIEILVKRRCLFFRELASRLDICKYAPGEITAHRYEIDCRHLASRQQSQIPAYLNQVLVGEDLVGGQVVVPPAEMGGGGRFHSGPCGTCEGCHLHFLFQQTRLCKRKQGQLYRCGKTSRIRNLVRPGNASFLPFRQAIDIALGLISEILSQVYDFQTFGAGMSLPELPAFAVCRAEEYQIHAVQRSIFAELHIGFPVDASVHLPEKVSCIA